MNDAWLFAYSQLKKRLRGEHQGEHFPSIDEGECICNFIRDCLEKPLKSKRNGRFEKACDSLERIIELLDTALKPYLGESDQWLSVLTGLEAGLLIAKFQLDFIKKRNG